jgi:SAM-dependent methyltransferase
MTEPRSGPSLWLSQIFFTLAVIPFFALPRLVATRPVRRVLAYAFGRSWAYRYRSVIDFYGPRYGAPLARALERAEALCPRPIETLVDTGTGTRYAATAAALRFPGARTLAFDLYLEMLSQPSYRPSEADERIQRVRSDSRHLPLPDASVDVVLAHNTTPIFAEMLRVCRPGGVVIFVDSAARWMSPIARLTGRRLPGVGHIEAEPCELGFYFVARKG